MTGEQAVRALRWYPRAWRARYGDELTALIEDYADEGRLRFRDHADLIRAGLSLRRRSRSVRDTRRRSQLVVIRLASGIAVVTVAVTLLFSAYQSQPNFVASAQPSVRHTTTVVIDVGGVVVAASAIAVRRGGQ